MSRAAPRPPTGTPIPSPNIWRQPDVYELLNEASDPDGLVWSALREVAPWAGGSIVDVGCGTGFHLPAYAVEGAEVIGVEPHAELATRAQRRCASLPRVRVVRSGAESLPLPPRSIDAVHARWAYFFGSGCEPGLAEAFRVLRPGGVLAVVDVDLLGDAYGSWFRAAWPHVNAERVERFWAGLGFRVRRLPVRWVFERRADLEAVLKIEFPEAVARAAITATSGLEVSVPTVVRWCRAAPSAN